ncbi:Flp family type IVb pilin [Falsiroseomonas oryziterrae]|uniref:Flp family type IVb pilin n=1 Tax=Falsiroseomonas oryziterrae TaxID=2911368 RepID=UPI0035577110
MFERFQQVIRSAGARIRGVADDRKGVTAVEYGVIAALIIVVCIAAISLVGTNLNVAFSTIGSSIAPR